MERNGIRRQEYRHRPAAVSGERLNRLHVNRVEVGAFLAVDLDVDEQLVHHRGGGLVLEGLVRHDVAPVARRITDAQQDRLLSGPRELECFRVVVRVCHHPHLLRRAGAAPGSRRESVP